MFNVINSSEMNNLKTFKNFQGRRQTFKENEMFFKDQGRNKFWQQIQGQFLAHKDIRQP